MHDQLARAGFRTLDPELGEAREFLGARGACRFDRLAPRGQAVLLARTQRAKIARAKEDDQLVLVSLAVERVVDAEARMAEVGPLLRRQHVAAVVVVRTAPGQ